MIDWFERARREISTPPRGGTAIAAVVGENSTPSTHNGDNGSSAPRGGGKFKEGGVRAWLAHIGETNPAEIAFTLEQCRQDPEARAYFLKRAEEVPPPVPTPPRQSARCGDCVHFNRIQHPHLGRCAVGPMRNPVGHWDTDRRGCVQFTPHS